MPLANQFPATLADAVVWHRSQHARCSANAEANDDPRRAADWVLVAAVHERIALLITEALTEPAPLETVTVSIRRSMLRRRRRSVA
jgi:hypothetical protein